MTQPVNTITSLAYVVAGAWVARRGRGAQPIAVWPVATALLVEGIGSAAYHGPGGRGGKAVHDVGLGLIGGGLLAQAAVARSGRAGRRRRVLGSAFLGAGALVHRRSRTGRPWCRPDGPFHGHGLWHVLSAAGLALLADAGVADAAARI